MLLARQYPTKIIETGMSKALALSKESLFSRKKKEENKIIPFVHNPNMFQIIHDSLPIIQNDNILKIDFKDTRRIWSKRQSPNLKPILTKAAFSQKKNTHGRCQEMRRQKM